MVAAMARSAYKRNDTGMTLTELLVGLVIMIAVILSAWSAFGVARQGSFTSDREAWLAHEIGSPMLVIEGVLMQQLSLVQGQDGFPDYAVSCVSDKDNDGSPEVTIFEAKDDGRLWVTSSEGTATPVKRSLGEDNYNVAGNTPLFVFYDNQGSAVTDPARIYLDARSVEIVIRARRDEDDITSRRRVWFRNRS